MKDTRGSVTMMAYVAMLFYSLYGAILFGNAVRRYSIQTDEIQTIQKAYSFELSEQELQRMYINLGAEEIKLDR